MDFDGTQKIIGRGAQADVVQYHGFAYKLYRPTYPAEWIAFEKQQQKAINEAGLCPVQYYDTDDDHIIKMDLLEGETLEKRILGGDTACFPLLAHAFSFVHEKDASHVAIPHLRDTAGMGLGEDEKEVVMPIIERLSAKYRECVCHLDMHFLNLMIPPEGPGYTIIDWMNARRAPLVFDYARTYVIFDEFSQEGLAAYKEYILPQMWAQGVPEEDFFDAVKACAILRKQEKS